MIHEFNWLQIIVLEAGVFFQVIALCMFAREWMQERAELRPHRHSSRSARPCLTPEQHEASRNIIPPGSKRATAGARKIVTADFSAPQVETTYAQAA